MSFPFELRDVLLEKVYLLCFVFLIDVEFKPE